MTRENAEEFQIKSQLRIVLVIVVKNRTDYKVIYDVGVGNRKYDVTIARTLIVCAPKLLSCAIID